MDEKQLLWSLYETERSFIQHHENQRTTASNILAAIAAGLIVAQGSGQLNSTGRLISSLMLIGIGVFGCIFAGKLTSLLKLHAERSYGYLSRLTKQLEVGHVSEVKVEAGIEVRKKHPFFSGVKLNRIWLGFHLLIAVTGVVYFCVLVFELLP